MFEDWKSQINDYVIRHIFRKPFTRFADELDRDIGELSGHYTSVLLNNGVIDENGNDTDIDFDEDDLLDAMLERFLQNHPCDDDQEVVYAELIDAYLALVEEASEDM